MNCKAAIAGAALAGMCAVAPGVGWSETIKIPSHVDGGCCLISAGSELQADLAATGKGEMGIPAAGFDRPGAGDHPEGDADSLPVAAAFGPDAVSPRSGGRSGDNAPATVGAVADPEPSTLTRLLIVFGDLREQLFGGP
jgi:hypothetical protein